ncbi:TPA: hypothetical protein ACJXXT_000236 [Pseudomonas aeruginosa]
MSEEEYKIKITKPSKYKRIDGWCDDGGSLTPEQIEYIITMDRIDNFLEQGIELTDEDTKYLLSLQAKISREEVTLFTIEEEHYLDTHDNSISGEITNFTIEDLKMFNQPKGEK